MLPISDVNTLTDIVDRDTASRAVQLRVLGAFAAIAFVLAGIGIHGLLSFSVSQRAQEIGVRRALREVIARSFPDIEFEGHVDTGSSSAPRDSDGSEQRTSRRHPLIWSGQIHHDYQSTPVRLRNISPTGAMIECSIPLHVGVEPLLDLGEAGQVFATVTWVVGDSAGLRFHEPFDLAHLARSKPEVASGRWERPGYLQPGPVADSPWDDKWDRMSLGELRQDLEGFLKR